MCAVSIKPNRVRVFIANSGTRDYKVTSSLIEGYNTDMELIPQRRDAIDEEIRANARKKGVGSSLGLTMSEMASVTTPEKWQERGRMFDEMFREDLKPGKSISGVITYNAGPIVELILTANFTGEQLATATVG